MLDKITSILHFVCCNDIYVTEKKYVTVWEEVFIPWKCGAVFHVKTRPFFHSRIYALRCTPSMFLTSVNVNTCAFTFPEYVTCRGYVKQTNHRQNVLMKVMHELIESKYTFFKRRKGLCCCCCFNTYVKGLPGKVLPCIKITY